MGTTKNKKRTDKLRGGYYTPQAITSFLCEWAITSPDQKVLEPSCGDGNFIEAAIKRFLELGVPEHKLYGLLQGVELIGEEAEKAKERALNYGLNATTIIHSDFFHFVSQINRCTTYDVVIGNPPFIRYQNFPEEHRDKAIALMQGLGLSPNKLTNIWVPFLVLSANLLNEGGKLAMVIPAELFQVKYAAETRIFLSRFFARITIVTFKKLVFDDIQQEVILLLCEKDASEHKGIRVIELSSLEELKSLDIGAFQGTRVKTLEHNSEKWTKYFLEEEEISLLRAIKADHRIKPASHILDVDVGLVTGRNEFFMMTEQAVAQWNLKAYTKKVVSRSAHLKGIVFSNEDLEDNTKSNIESYLFSPPNEDFYELPRECQDYIQYGESQGYHTGYKCRIRKRWYITPSFWTPDVFALRQVGDYPKLIMNQTNASSTDTIHRARLKRPLDPEIVVLSFINSLSFAFSEILGRSYGGGVLTFEPTEIEEIPLPLLQAVSVDFAYIDGLIRQRKIEEAMDIIDEALLVKQLKMKKSEVKALRSIWKKLSDRRLNRK